MTHTGQAEALAREGRCEWVEGDWWRCMATVDGGPMGMLRIEVPASMCAMPQSKVPVGARERFARHRRAGPGPWAVVGLDRRGIERYRVSGYGDEEEAQATLEFHPGGTGLTYSALLEGEGAEPHSDGEA